MSPSPEDLNLPFEPQDRTEVDLTGALLVAGVVVMAAKIPSAIGDVPALIFRFALPGDVGFANPVVLPLDGAQQGGEIVDLVRAAVERALA